MKSDTDIVALRQPESADDPLTGIGALGVRRTPLRANKS